MKKIIAISLFVQLSLLLQAQIAPVDMEFNVIKSYAGWKANTKIQISGVQHVTEVLDNNSAPEERFFLIEKGDHSRHEVKSRFDGALEVIPKSPDDIWNYYTIGSVLNMIQKKGFQTSLRNELEDDAIEFIYRLENDGRAFSDPYLENYIYSLVSKIAPTTLVDGRPGNVNIVILNDEEQNAFTFSNGTIVITTGLLSILHSEDELVAILSHEIAHFVFDHSIANINAAIKRQKRAEFWAAVATGVAAAGEVYAASKDPYYIPGAATIGTAVISTAIASSYIKQQGMEYNHEQENEADEAAIKILELLGYRKEALATALSRMRNIYLEERSNASYFTSYTHPSLNERIKKLGTPSKTNDSKFEKMVSFAVTSVAAKKVSNRRFRQALGLVDQNISNGVGIANDYIMKASCMLALRNDDQSNNDALSCVLTAKQLDPLNINFYKPETIALLRLNRKQQASDTLEEYRKALKNASAQLKEIESDEVWAYWNSYFSKEDIWANNMLIKLKGM